MSIEHFTSYFRFLQDIHMELQLTFIYKECLLFGIPLVGIILHTFEEKKWSNIGGKIRGENFLAETKLSSSMSENFKLGLNQGVVD